MRRSDGSARPPTEMMSSCGSWCPARRRCSPGPWECEPMKRSPVVALCALLLVAVALSAEDKPQAPFAPVPPANPYIVPADSPYYVPGAGTPGEGPRVGHVGDPGAAVAPDELGKQEEGDAALAAFLLGYIVGQQPAAE